MDATRHQSLIRLGLTGGIATGKSTLLQHWQHAGAAGVESDVLAHQTLAPDTPTWTEVGRIFGKEVLNPDRTVNRRRLGEIVFHDEAKRQQLNQIIHPAVRRLWTAELDRLARDGRTEVAVVAIPLLYEVAAEKEFDYVVAVGCSEPTQLARLAAKGLDETQARARIRAQLPVQTKLDRADFVIWNDGSLPVLYRQADIIWKTINPAPSGIKESDHAPTQKA